MKRRFYFPIILKLVILSTLMLAIVTLIVSYKSSLLFEAISIDREEATNLNIADSASYEVDNLIQSYVDKITFYGLDLLKKSQTGTTEVDTVFNNDADFFGIHISKFPEADAGLSNNFLFVNKINSSKDMDLRLILHKLSENLARNSEYLKEGKVQVLNLSTKNSLALIAIGIPLVKNELGQITSVAWGFLKIDRVQRAFANKSDRTMYLIDQDAHILAHPNEKYVLHSKDAANFPIVKEALVSNVRVMQKYFVSNLSKEKTLGAFAKTSTDLVVISEVPISVILAPSLLVKKNNFFILGVAISISVFLTFLFSQSLTSPIEKLLLLTKEISAGNFDVEAKKVIRSRDEVGFLALAFDDMTTGLRERDKMKNLFTKFHGTTVTEELLKNEISLGGKRKEVTVFFSDIRGFTDFSEGHTPEEVVSMLNEYFEVMVKIINDNGGVVDKFIGDAIMAVWGVPHRSDDDAIHAVKACLDMRIALDELNSDRLSRGFSPIKIGMGLHSGEAISGQIGSSQRMEFTIIGDAVNTASRIEGATKSFGTDLLISQEVTEKISDQFILDKAGEATVQGKTENLILFKVTGFNDDGVARIIQTPYSSYEAIEDKKSKVA